MSESESRSSTSCSCINSVLLFTANVFTGRPFAVLLITLALAVGLSWLGLSQNGLPEFDDPYLGFETRFTPIANRLITLENLRHEVNRLQVLENYPGEKITGKEWRRRRGFAENVGSCTDFPLDEYGRIALELHQATIFSTEVLSLICYFQKLIEEISAYTDLCEHDGDRHCCQMWSLPNYVTQNANKSDCAELKVEDIEDFRTKVDACIEVYSNSSQNEDCLFRRQACPIACHRGGPLHTALYYTMDKSYLHKNATKYAMLILPVPKTPQARPLMEYFQEKIASLKIPNERVALAGYDFGGKDSLFRSYLLSDLQYVVLASMIIFVIVCIYTKSVFVSVISFGVLVLSLGSAYFLYTSVFNISYFPFMNMLVTIIVLGIGTDSTLIFSVVWQRLKIDHDVRRKDARKLMMATTLQETTATLFITTCTTAGAFFASLTSSITTIRCFSIFAGTAIIISFMLLYVCVPTSLILSDQVCAYFHSTLNSNPEKSKFVAKVLQLLEKIHLVQSAMAVRVPVTCRLIVDKVAKSHLIWISSFLTFSGVLVWASIVLFHSPGFQLPSSEQFQLLTKSHPVERFDREVEPYFNEHSQTDENDFKMTLYLVWGVKDLDSGHGLDPLDNGHLEFDPTFSLSPRENQKWMRKLCKRVQKQLFYDQVVNSATGSNLDSCFMDTMVSWMKRDCEHFLLKNGTYKPCCKSSKYPYEETVFERCIGLAARDVYRTPSFYFQPDIAGPKFRLETNGSLGTFVLRIKTNVLYSLVYEKMNAFYEEAETFFKEVQEKAPPGLENGFFVSAHFDFYDLQKSLMEETWMSVLLSVGLCFIFLWISSWSVSVAIGAVISIFAIVTVTAAVLIQAFDWKLGVFESIAVTVAVGLSDFTAHHSLEFSKRKSVMSMTSPTFFSALSTVIMGLSMMLFSSVLVYQQIGSFFFVLVVISWLYSVFFLTPILIMFDKIVSTVVAGFKFTFCNEEEGRRRKDDDDSSSNSNFIVENVNATRVPEKKPSIMMEKWILLKKFAQETTV